MFFLYILISSLVTTQLFCDRHLKTFRKLFFSSSARYTSVENLLIQGVLIDRKCSSDASFQRDFLALASSFRDSGQY
ncbi:hypothetical protein METBIDRAFT_30301 [Metschnikowia bicuspidata var. bicuspidata NRRL YB-4993]|uniref:Secreted protein n=1 Tax=Metschnikowia bicuspidata var. bicuspidata NRRL YB-4993 TaxID=869754 RepID=A0A1A0HJ79_9ASCO|nr:hypothetical protein METBIDRAFT_30301 [Metschnikowia bicuspidata var. bicuspidata NRRL YB-4993]OBA23942.1 hypothetical protein METBIDRAFT_30301 [Metschnikowia bicuspidata var. bicuspidata NRRL YB-4993]